MRPSLMAAALIPIFAVSAASAAEFGREEAMKQSHKLKCYQNYVPIQIIQKLNESTFFGYTQFSVGIPEPLLLVYAIGQRPVSSGGTMLSPRSGLIFLQKRTIPMENGFRKTVSVLKIGDDRCANLWAIIEKATLAK